MAKHYHIEAQPGDIAELVLLPGDPKRAEFIAKNYLEDAKLYNTVRGMSGFTGTYKGKRVSVQGTGMGMPSAGIYIHELINVYGAKKLVRIGSCGSLQEKVGLRDIILAMSACSNSAMITRRFFHQTYAPTANFDYFSRRTPLLKKRGLTFMSVHC